MKAEFVVTKKLGRPRETRRFFDCTDLDFRWIFSTVTFARLKLRLTTV